MGQSRGSSRREGEHVKRGQVYDAILGPLGEAWGSEQAGFRPVIVVSRDAINAASNVVVIVPCTTYREGRNIYPSQVLLEAPEGDLEADSLALGEQVRAISKRRLRQLRGTVSDPVLGEVEKALIVTLDLPDI